MKVAAMRERVRTKLLEYWGESDKRVAESKNILDSTAFTSHIKAYEREIIAATLKIAGVGIQLTEDIMHQLNQDTSPPQSLKKYRNKIISSHGVLQKQNTALRDVYLQESELDMKERWRFLAFRIATGLSFAAIILLTGYLAKIWEIPLPLLRPLG